jgi:hypothetical protein
MRKLITLFKVEMKKTSATKQKADMKKTTQTKPANFRSSVVEASRKQRENVNSTRVDLTTSSPRLGHTRRT